ncbi:palmdelphin-like isoform X1 [Hypomesus transpacificus]|uniref:palmdelphin-like isoform X1 n=1 Tax=Hypomesus transpacificus TaxID=137520 RepID=UPI001F08172A|nr:palmdelphin-like isoform X1 [Hypomesus transpacificus]
MEEADLLKERLLAITDKRRVQEEIAKKRRQIEEEKLKLQYLKKKALREQWLMDGLSPQNEEEQQAIKQQAQDHQDQTVLLQSNIDRMEEEIESLETQELSISANEEVILRRLKEVEKTPEDIIKELNAEYQTDPIQYMYSPISDLSQFYESLPQKNPSPKPQPDKDEEPKKAMFAMEISVEKDHRTGESQVVSTATVTPQEFQQRGVKVFDDGRKSVYALPSEGSEARNGVGELSHLEVDELLRQATEGKVPSEVQYHQPVYAAPYTASRPGTPKRPDEVQLSPGSNGHRTPDNTPSPLQNEPVDRDGAPNWGEGRQTPRKTPIPSPSPFQPDIIPRDGAQTWAEGRQTPCKTPTPGPSPFQPDMMSREQAPNWEEGLRAPSKTPSPFQLDTTPRDGAQSWGEKTQQSQSHIPNIHAPAYQHPPHPGGHQEIRTGQGNGLSNGGGSGTGPNRLKPSTFSSAQRCGESPCPVPLMEGTVQEYRRQSPFYLDDESALNVVNTLPPDLASEPVTMIFMGYQTAEDEEDEEDIQAELVVIGNDNDDPNSNDSFISYHPEGYRSQIFQPHLTGKALSLAGYPEDSTNSDDLQLHRPTFSHKPIKRSPCLDRQTDREGNEVSATAGINNSIKKQRRTYRSSHYVSLSLPLSFSLSSSIDWASSFR